MEFRKIALPVMAAAAMGLVACGENGTTEQITNNYTSGMEIVDLVSSLPKCTADNAGEQYLVKADGEAYFCNGKDWKVLGGSGVTASDYGCETKPLADDRGVAIYCGGDSIGVVLNGAKGDKGDDGERGEQGIQGVAGEKGETGAQGIQGEKGVAGADGKDGLNGADGKPGEKGETGAQGIQGEQGVAGADGKDGAAGKDGADGVGCKVVGQTAESVTIQCGDDKFSMNLNGGSAGDIIEEDPGVSLAMLKGVSQKGPYINGASVTLFELDGSKSLMQTGRTFGGEIVSDDGRFSVNNVTLNSSYVRLTANGYYRNEVSGENTTSALTLYAYSDLKRRTSVNINLLTHLEYYRVGYLMGNSDGSLTITAAKKMAQKEIFDQFHIGNEGFKNSEDMDVFGSSEGDAALLAISVLLQGNRNVTELTSLLSDFGTKIAEKGEWKDPVTRAKIADWADSVDLGLKGGLTLPKIESNVSGWGLGTVPAFQKYVRNFWYKEYGLGDCDESNKSVVKHDTNSRTAYYSSKYAYDGSTDQKVRYTCDNKDSLGRTFGEFRWRRASNIEKDTMGLKHGELSTHEQASVINGQVNTDHVYVYEGKQYRRGTALDKSLGLGGCTKARVDSVWKSGSAWYTCVDISSTVLNALGTKTAWRTSTNIEKDTIHWSNLKSNFDGEVSKGQVSDNYYIYEKSKGAWREATQTEYDTYDYKNNKDWTADTVDGAYKLGEVSKSQYYVFDKTQGAWRMETTAFDHTHEIDGCTETREGEYIRSAKSDSVYYCSDKAWSETSELVNDAYSAAVECRTLDDAGKTVYGHFNKKYLYVCQGEKGWMFGRNITLDKAYFVDSRDFQVYYMVEIGSQTWMAENLNYDYNEGTAESYCYNYSSANCDKYGRLYLWSAAMDSAAVFSNAGEGCGYGKTCDVASTGSTTVVRGVCPEGWHLPSISDWSTLWTAIGGTSTAGTKLKSASGWDGNGNGADNYGFSVLPAGIRDKYGNFYCVGSCANFWSSTEGYGADALNNDFGSSYAPVGQGGDGKNSGFSVRCLKDSP
ncbi:MAG: hypothetical protein MJY98_02200 [Fibrobacter sp.]|nr:hypothetical protein [Fibrobacter sp.]